MWLLTSYIVTHQAEDFLMSVVTILPVHGFPFKTLVTAMVRKFYCYDQGFPFTNLQILSDF